MTNPNHNVLTCTARHDGAYLVTFKPKGSGPSAAVSTAPMEPGDGFTLSGWDNGCPVATPNRKRAA